MDKRVILAVAGSGKTYHIVEQLNETKRFLIITYTISNTENLRNEIINKFGYIPTNIKIKSYFTFLYSFCFKPFLANEIDRKGISWKLPKSFFDKSFLTKNGYLYHNRIAMLIIKQNVVPSVNQRLEKYYDCLLIDEVQDFGGHDFNLLSEISKSDLDILFVGDFFQHTFTTSSDGKTNINLHKSSADYLQKYRDLNFTIDNTTLVNSRRCSKTICDFIRKKIGIEIYSNGNLETEYKLITDETEADRIFNDSKIIKLFLQEHYAYDCYSDNWGSCKGLEFDNVCVVINDDTLKLYNNNGLTNLKPTIKNKFYVACSRTKNNLYFVPMKMYKKHKKITHKKTVG
jgi:DNA helicase-2/ATP-dependent DNA helicase PcrA